MRGSPTTIASVVARDKATLSRFLSRRKLSPRGPASPKLEHMETMTTAACWPWNLSTDPMRASDGSASCNLTFTDMKYLTEQVYTFAGHSWRSFDMARMPV